VGDSRVDALPRTELRDIKDGTVAEGSSSHRILPTFTGDDPFLKLFLRDDGEKGL
jgi:hypothetical protein